MVRPTATETTDSDDTGDGGSFLPSLCEATVKRVNVQVPDEIHTRAKVIAVLKGITLSEYFERAVREAVEDDKDVLREIKTK